MHLGKRAIIVHYSGGLGSSAPGILFSCNLSSCSAHTMMKMSLPMRSQCNSTRLSTLLPVHDDVCYMIRNVKLKCVIIFITAVCFQSLFLIKLKWPKNKSIYNSVSLHALTLLSVSRKDFLPNFLRKSCVRNINDNFFF